MSQTQRQQPRPDRVRSPLEYLIKTVAPEGATAPTLTPEDWRQAIDTLQNAALRRDGDAAARHTEIRRRMRALAQAARSLGRP